jgi:PAS domain S-box-containing protein
LSARAPEPRNSYAADRRVDGARVDAARLDAVQRLQSTALGSRALQRLTDLAASLLDAEVAQVSLLGEVQTAVAVSGRPGGVGAQRLLDDSLCAVAATGAPEPLAIPDAAADPRVAGRAPVTSGRIRSYLGIPLGTPPGPWFGALCVYGSQPREWSERDVAVLRLLADSVAAELELSALSRDLESSRLRFDLAIDAAGIGSFDWDLPSGTLTWDDRLLEIFGYERGGFDGRIEGFNARLHPDDLVRVTAALQHAIDTCGNFEAEYRIVRPGGDMRWVLARGRALCDDHGTAVRFLGAAYDTTDQRQGDARVSRVLEAMNAAFFSLDREWCFDYVNAEAERVLARPREELLGRSIWTEFPEAPGSEFEANYRGAVETGEERVFEAYYPAPLDAWYEVRAWPGPDGLSVYFLDISQRRAADERARASAARLGVVAEVTAVLSRTMGPGEAEDAALQRVAEVVVPVLGDWAITSLVDDEGRVRDVGSWHGDPAEREVTARYANLRLAALEPDMPFPTALREKRLVEIDDVQGRVAPYVRGAARPLFERLAAASSAMVPLVARGRTVGAITLYRGADRPLAGPEDLAALREVADRAALALDNSRLYDQQRRLAETLQRSMLTAPPEPDHAEIEVRYEPAVEVAEVGGDWYDAFLQPGGGTVLVIGDVVGHDTVAAAAMGQLRGLLRGIAYRQGTGPADVLRELDVAMAGLEVGSMATAAIARIEQSVEERADGVTRLRWSNAGHPPPLLLHADGRTELLTGGHTDLMLGVDASYERSEWVVTVARGATVLLYTDGLVEGPGLLLDDGVELLRAGLVELADRPLPELCDELLARMRPRGVRDDIALVALRLHPQDRPRPASAAPAHVPPGVPAEPDGPR